MRVVKLLSLSSVPDHILVKLVDPEHCLQQSRHRFVTVVRISVLLWLEELIDITGLKQRSQFLLEELASVLNHLEVSQEVLEVALHKVPRRDVLTVALGVWHFFGTGNHLSVVVKPPDKRRNA